VDPTTQAGTSWTRVTVKGLVTIKTGLGGGPIGATYRELLDARVEDKARRSFP
jgi:hypothetical protein